MDNTYVFYLFRQPSNFTLPTIDAGRNLTVGSLERISFSATAISDEAGEPVAANYMRVAIPKGSASVSPSSSTGTATSAPSNGVATLASGPQMVAMVLGIVSGFLYR